MDTVPLNSFKSYLEDRFQFVDYDGTKLNITSITTGVPQGSILGPFLFIIYIYIYIHIYNRHQWSDRQFQSYTICWWYKSDQSPELFQSISYVKKINIQQISDNINTEPTDFCEALRQLVNIECEKTKHMLFHRRQRDIGNLVPCLKIKDEPVERVTKFNLLDLTIDETIYLQPRCNRYLIRSP